jgi:hypothetical protein
MRCGLVVAAAVMSLQIEGVYCWPGETCSVAVCTGAVRWSVWHGNEWLARRPSGAAFTLESKV